MDFKTHYEEFKVQAKDLVEKVHSLVREGNIRRIIIKDEKGNTFIEIPLTVGVVTALAVPVLAGLGAIAALVANFTIGVERSATPPGAEAVPKEEATQATAQERQ
jgi:phage-related minor tail protein